MPGGSETVLVVDDEALICSLLEDALGALGYKCLIASNGNEALKRIEDFQGKIDLLLTDVIVAEMNGLELAEEIKKTLPDMKVMFMSGYTENMITDSDIGLFEPGVNFISKPITITSLAKKVRSVLDS